MVVEEKFEEHQGLGKIRVPRLAPHRGQRTFAASVVATVAVGVVAIALAGCSGGETNSSPSLMQGFPTAIPVVAGDVVASNSSGAAWGATVKVANEVAQQSALQQLKDTGFTVIGMSGTSSADRVYSLANNEYSVRLSFATAKNDRTVTYGVSPRGTDK